MPKLLYDTKFLQLKATESKSGKDWVYSHRPNASCAVIILPIINNESILFIKEERPPIQAENIAKYSIALPAGLVGDERIGESIIDAIKSELLEETGLVANKIDIKTEKVASSPGCTSETFVIAIAHIDEYKPVQEPINDDGVIVDRILIKKTQLFRWLKEQENSDTILTAQTLAALFYLYEQETK